MRKLNPCVASVCEARDRNERESVSVIRPPTHTGVYIPHTHTHTCLTHCLDVRLKDSRTWHVSNRKTSEKCVTSHQPERRACVITAHKNPTVSVHIRLQGGGTPAACRNRNTYRAPNLEHYNSKASCVCSQREASRKLQSDISFWSLVLTLRCQKKSNYYTWTEN